MRSLHDRFKLSDRVALVTGAAGHLGTVMADTLGELGASLILVDLPGTDLEIIGATLGEKWGINAEALYCDLEDETSRCKLIEQISDRYRFLNILINNAAFVGDSNLHGWTERFERQSVSTWRRAVEVNLTAPFHLVQGLLPLMKIAEGASIINVGSIYGEYGPDWGLYEQTEMANPAAYAASKGGVMQLTRWLATTLAPTIRVNAISPGGVFRGQNPVFVQRYELRTPLGRMATEEDFRGVTALLASDLSSYITGQTIRVDGGWGTW